ncbi:uncharacterized protein EI97DRAFT_455660 [Westerdykella ornata]|uniref:Uncharacterized protein n=1 Tax=Westerdykella ornata TaxID=318751 RepID=A0A6A6JTH4_WESOR|nr:uncharacterized protein EI97DRAFT_455660 [Westerdykella ornata]KAF2279413.1 hypothetical protein EI97DRAFT_455660 [Westerdykella ornata]
MDFHAAVKVGQHTPDFTTLQMLSPLQTYSPQIIDGPYPFSAGSESNSAHFTAHPMEKQYAQPSRLTPRTPETFAYVGPLPVSDSFEQYASNQCWPQPEQIPIGLGFEGDGSGLLPLDTSMRVWRPHYTAQPAPVPPTPQYLSAVSDSPETATIWPTPITSVSPSQPPHSRAVPSLSLSECSVQESESPHETQDEWPCFQEPQHDGFNSTPVTSTPYLDSIKNLPMVPTEWDGAMTSARSSSF